MSLPTITLIDSQTTNGSSPRTASVSVSPGDVLVQCFADIVSGTTVSFDPQFAGQVTFEDGSNFSGAKDEGGNAGTSFYCGLWSVKIADTDNHGSRTVIVTTTFAGSTRRGLLFKITPGGSDIIPARSSRVVSHANFGTTSGATGAQTVTLSMSGSGLAAGRSGVGVEVCYCTNSIASGIAADFDNNGTDETAQHGSTGTGLAINSAGFAVFIRTWDGSGGSDDAARPGSTIGLHFLSNPGASRCYLGVVYATSSQKDHATAAIAGNGTIAATGFVKHNFNTMYHNSGIALTAKAVMQGPLRFPRAKSPLAIGSKAQLRWKQLPKANKKSGLAISAKASLRGGSRLLTAPSSPFTMDGLGSLHTHVWNGAATITGSGTIAATGSVKHHSNAFIFGTGTIAATGQRKAHLTAAITGLGAIAATGKAVHHATATLVGNGVFAASATHVVHGTAGIVGSGAIAATGFTKHHATAAIAGTGAIAATGHVNRNATDAIVGTGTIAATGQVKKHATATITGSGTIAADAHVAHHANASLFGFGNIAASAAGNTKSHGDAVVSGFGIFQATGQRKAHVTAAIQGNGIISASCTRKQHATGAISGTGLITATAGGTTGADAAILSTGRFTATGHRIAHANASIHGQGVFAAATESDVTDGSGNFLAFFMR